MMRDKFNFSGFLTFLVLVVAVGVLGAHVFGAISVDGADCDTVGIWSVGIRAVEGVPVPVNDEAELRAAILIGSSVDLGDDITISGEPLLIISGTNNYPITINGNGHTLTQISEDCSVISIDTTQDITIKNLTITGGQATNGGGICFDGSGSLIVENSTIYDNTGGIAINGGSGYIMNSSIVSNTGHGISVGNGATAYVTFCTVADNTGIGVVGDSDSYIGYSIVVGNQDDASGVGSWGYNVFGENNWVSADTDIENQPRNTVLSGQLADNNTKNGTYTIALPAGSPAINHVLLYESSEEGQDQRGYPRPGANKTNKMRADAGAFETQGSSPPPPPPPPDPSPDIRVIGVTLDRVTLTIRPGEPETLTATVSPDNAKDKSVVWSSSNPSAATVSDATVTGVSDGNAVITVTTADGGFTASCAVLVSSDAHLPPVPELSTFKLDLAPGETATVTSPVEGSWETSNASVVEISEAPFEGARALSVSGKTVHARASGLGSAVVTFTRFDGETASVSVFVSPKAIVGMNDELAKDDVGLNILSPDLFPSVDARVEKDAPAMVCYSPSGKPAGVVEVDISDTVRYPDVSRVFLPMQYSLGLTEREMTAHCESVGRTIDLDELFARDGTPSAAVLEEFFNVFVIQKEILQGARKGELARLLGAGRDQLVTPQDALSAGILTVNVDAAERKVRLEFRYMVKDGTETPVFSGKQIITGDGLADRLIVDPMWTNMRKASDSPAPDGGGGCTTTFAPLAILALAGLVLRRR